MFTLDFGSVSSVCRCVWSASERVYKCSRWYLGTALLRPANNTKQHCLVLSHLLSQCGGRFVRDSGFSYSVLGFDGWQMFGLSWFAINSAVAIEFSLRRLAHVVDVPVLLCGFFRNINRIFALFRWFLSLLFLLVYLWQWKWLVGNAVYFCGQTTWFELN